MGSQYRSGIYFTKEEQRVTALAAKEKEQLKYHDPMVTEIMPAKIWYPAEEYHQRYLQKGQKGATKRILRACKLDMCQYLSLRRPMCKSWKPESYLMLRVINFPFIRDVLFGLSQGITLHLL